MKKNTYIVLTAASSLLLLSPLAAEDKIQLPEVTTTVSGDSLTAGKNAIPDFTGLVPNGTAAEAPLPQLPDAQGATVTTEPEADLSYDSEKSVYAEGLIGGGYPGFFSGDFSVYKSSGDNPFRLRFSHESANGYGAHEAADGFFDSTTELSGNKQITFKNAVLNFGAAYNTITNGMQSLSPCFFDNTQQNVNSMNSITWKLPYGFGIELGVGGQWYSRYAGKDSNYTGTSTFQQNGASILDLHPLFNVGWSNSIASIGFTAQYEYETTLRSMEFVTDSVGLLYDGPTTLNVHRGQFGFAGGWSNSTVSLDGAIALVVGTALGNSALVAPFSVGVSAQHQSASATQPISFSLRGGLDSVLPQYADLEQQYRYTYLEYLPSETSDWFVSLKGAVPVSTHFVFNMSGDWRMTAFGNGIWEPQYVSNATECGLYTYKQIARTLIDSDVGFSFLYKILTLGIDWKANWLYIPADEYAYTIGATCSVLAADGFWGTNIAVREALGESVDTVPIINAGGFVRLRDSLRLALELNDAIKLCTGTNRAYAKSRYLSRAGSVTLLVKFFF